MGDVPLAPYGMLRHIATGLWHTVAFGGMLRRKRRNMPHAPDGVIAALVTIRSK